MSSLIGLRDLYIQRPILFFLCVLYSSNLCYAFIKNKRVIHVYLQEWPMRCWLNYHPLSAYTWLFSLFSYTFCLAHLNIFLWVSCFPNNKLYTTIVVVLLCFCIKHFQRYNLSHHRMMLRSIKLSCCKIRTMDVNMYIILYIF